jgi:hypothetical protein
MLFVGEAPPASGRFFYRSDSGLFRAFQETFVTAFPDLNASDFLASFRALDCYFVDLCPMPVDHLAAQRRRSACAQGEPLLRRTLAQLRPEIVVTVVRSIAPNVLRARRQANWTGTYLELPYPGRWRHHRAVFQAALVPLLRRALFPQKLISQ